MGKINRTSIDRRKKPLLHELSGNLSSKFRFNQRHYILSGVAIHAPDFLLGNIGSSIDTGSLFNFCQSTTVVTPIVTVIPICTASLRLMHNTKISHDFVLNLNEQGLHGALDLCLGHSVIFRQCSRGRLFFVLIFFRISRIISLFLLLGPWLGCCFINYSLHPSFTVLPTIIVGICQSYEAVGNASTKLIDSIRFVHL